MAQQREKEDTTDLKVPESLSTLPSLSTCTQSLQLPHPTPTPTPNPPTPTLKLMDPPPPHPHPHPHPHPDESRSTNSLPKKSSKRSRDEQEVKRCSCNGCNKKLGLMGFRCRCGDSFCPKHRYSDRHDCSFDYKAAGKETIAKENPVVRASKLLKV